MLIRIIAFIFFVGLVNCKYQAQVNTTVTLTPTTDTYIDEEYGTTSFNSNTSLFVGVFENSAKRILMKYNISSLPADALFVSAKLRIKVRSEESGAQNESFVLQKITETWNTENVTFDSQPRTQTEDQIVHSELQSTYRIFNVMEHLQYWFDGNTNFGWMILCDNETEDGLSEYFSSDAGTSVSPELVIEYYLPFKFESATIIHASSLTQTDASISSTIVNGSSNLSYVWYTGSTGNVISGATSSTLSNIGYGWYGLKIQDGGGIPEYRAFVVGVKDESVDITFAPGPNYMDDADLVDGPITNGVSSRVYNRSNYGSRTISYSRDYSSTRDKTIMQFRLWVDSRLEFEKADLKLDGAGHVNNSYGNGLDISLITSAWKENAVTWNTVPTYNDKILNWIPENAAASGDITTVNMIPFWEYWKTNNNSNNGFIMEIPNMNLSNRMMVFCSSEYANISRRPKIEFTVRVERGYIASFNEENELGEIQVNMAEIPNKVGPYYYRLSAQPIIDINEEYDLIRDSIYEGFLDSNSFFIGDSSALKTYSDLPLGNYYLSVFDNLRSRIVDQKVNLMGKIDISSNSGFVVSRNQLESKKTNSSGLIDLFIDDQSISEIVFEPQDVSGKQLFGFVGSTQTATNTINNYSFGYKVENSTVDVIFNGAIVGNHAILTNNLSLIFNKGIVLYKLGEVTLYSSAMSVETSYKGGIYNEDKDLITKFNFSTATKKKFNNTIKGIQHHTCGGGTGGFSFYVAPNSFPMSISSNKQSYPLTSYEFNWEIFKDGISVDLGNSGIQTPPFTAVVYNYNTSITGPGVYTVVVTVDMNFSGQLTWETNTSTVYIGYEGDWADTYLYTTLNNSINRNSITAGQYSFSRSKNILLPNDPGWIIFKPNVNNNNTYSNYLRVSTQNPTSMSPQFLDIGSMIFGKNNISQTMNWIVASMQSSPLYAISNNSTIKLDIQQSIIKVYSNNTYLGFMPRPSGKIFLRANSLLLNDGFNDVLMSFGCAPIQPLSKIGYTELKGTLDGGFAHAVEGKIKFTFDEENDVSSGKYLPFSIYDDNHDLMVKSDHQGNITDGNNSPSSQITNLSYNYDDNRYVLDISNIQNLVLDKLYTLEVTTFGGEKKLMKFRYKN